LIGRQSSYPPLRQPWTQTVEGGSFPLTLTYVEPAVERPDNMPHVAIGLPPGLNEDAHVQYPFVRRLVRAAWRAGEWATVVTYDSPHKGQDCFTYDFKTRRWLTAARAATDTLETPLDVTAHSLAWPCAIDSADQLAHEARLRTITGINPAHHRNERRNHHVDVAVSLSHLIGEVFSRHRFGTRRGGAATIWRLTRNSMSHIWDDVGGAIREAAEVLVGDSSSLAADLSRDPRVGVAVGLGRYDKITPACESLAKLWAAEFAGPIAVWNTDHVGPIANRSLAPQVYSLMMAARNNSGIAA